MADDQDISPFADDENNATQLLRGLISPAPAQALVLPPPDTPPPTKAGQSTPVTGSLATPPSQAKPKISPAPVDDAGRAAQLELARSQHALPTNLYQQQYQPSLETKTRRGLARYFSGSIGGALGANYGVPNKNYAVDEAARQGSSPDRSNDPSYVKVQSNGQIGYLPKANLKKAQLRDKNLKVLK